MSERRRLTKRQPPESSSAARAHDEESARTRRRDLPDRAAAPRLWQAGNSAINRLLNGDGQPLTSETRTEMEGAFRQDFSTVRVHRDAAAGSAADALDAGAFTQGDDIYLGSDSPAPDSTAGRELLAHELAHVVQQREATELKDEVSRPGDRSERAADRAAEQASRGRAVESAPAAAQPAVQRSNGEPAKTAKRVDVVIALQRYFEREAHAQGGKKELKVNQKVKDAVLMFFDPVPALGIHSLLNRPHLWKPDELADALAVHLPDTVEPRLLAYLESLPERAPTPEFIERAHGHYEKVKAGGPEREQPELEVGSQKDVEEGMKQVQEAQGGQPEEQTFPPSPLSTVKFDPMFLGRFFGGMGGVVKPPRPARPQPEARSYTDVETAIEQIRPDALIPAAVRGFAQSLGFADARVFARALAHKLDVAQQQNQETVEIDLGKVYNTAKYRDEMAAVVEQIIDHVCDALPHHASNVKNVNIYFGEKLAASGQKRSLD